jgi:beta-lactamase class A
MGLGIAIYSLLAFPSQSGAGRGIKAATSTSSQATHSRHAAMATTTTSQASDPSKPSELPFPSTITSFVTGRSGTVTAALDELNTGDTYVLNPGIQEDEASIVKVDIMATLLSQNPGDPTDYAAQTQSLLSSMIEESDNDSATALWDQVGGPEGIGAFNKEIGMTDTVPSQCVVCPGFPWPGWGLSETTAQDQAQLLRELCFQASRSLRSSATSASP